MLCLYSLDKIKFFENYILGIKEKKIEETIASSTLGNIIHDALELLYKNLVGENLNVKLLGKLKTKINECVEEAALQYVRKRSLQKGKNVIIIETAKNYVSKVIDIDINHINKGNSIKIIDIEKEFKKELINGNQKYIIRGKIDRIDELNGELRIIDYKSGKKLYKRNLDLKEVKDLNDEKSIYNLQLLFYVIGIFKEMKKRDIKTGIISLKNIKDGVLEGIYEGETILNNENIKVYEKEIIRIINEILDVNIVFEN